MCSPLNNYLHLKFLTFNFILNFISRGTNISFYMKNFSNDLKEKNIFVSPSQAEC